MADGNQILKRLTELPEEDLAFGNDVYQVEFSKRPQLKPGDGTEADTRKIFGRQYRFRLTDAIDDCPEYLSDRQTLEQYV
jgi:hypothetical protein